MKWWIVAAVVGVLLMTVSLKSGHPPDTVKCGNEVMGPGDVCEESRRGHTTSARTYEEMKSSAETSARNFDTWGRWVYLGGGFVLTAGGVVGIVMTRRRRRRLAAQPQAPLPPNVLFVQRPYQAPQYQSAQPAPQQTPQQYAPQQYPPQQYPPQQQFGPQRSGPPPRRPYPPQSFGPTGTPPDPPH